jgi:Alr-MurF fusion protein
VNVAIDYQFDEIAAITGGHIDQRTNAIPIRQLLLDSRKVLTAEHTIFFGLNTSANKYVTELYQKGVKNFLLEYTPDLKEIPDANVIVVPDAIVALQSLAKHHRNRFNIPVIGITGSNGKTIVKEWLNQLLQDRNVIARSPKSYNSQIGVPLSVLQLRRQHTLAIFEAGISQPGEMDNLRNIINPSIGIFTNIGEAHSEGFHDISEKVKEKLKLFTNAETLIYSNDYSLIKEQLQHLNSHRKFFMWGRQNDSSLVIKEVNKTGSITVITAIYQGSETSVTIPFNDDASIENAIHCWSALLLLKVPEGVVANKMLQLQPVEMRMELKQGVNNCSVINDAYSADITSLHIALDFLEQQKQHSRHTLVLSDILQSGKEEEQLYGEIAALLQHKHINRFIAVGPELYRQRQLFTFIPETHFFPSVEELRRQFYALNFHDEAILIKGARVFEFEQISALLEYKAHQTILSVNITALVHNLKVYRKMLHPGTKIMAMVKAFSYGSGSYEIANILQFNKVDYLTVAYVDEGVELRKAGITMPIMVMNTEESSFNLLVQHYLEPELYSFDIFYAFKNYLKTSAIDQYPVHIKLDTGMHRLGFEPDDLPKLVSLLQQDNVMQVVSVFSHLVASDDPEKDSLTFNQLQLFNDCSSLLEAGLGYSFIKHIANTTAIAKDASLQLDMVRLGIGLYGIDANQKMQQQLRPVSELTTTIAQVRKVKAGETVGYGGKFSLQRDSTVATVRIGYADGYPRRLSHGIGRMMIKGRLFPVVGSVCMDMTMLDITDADDVIVGDAVKVFGASLPLQSLAQWAETIPYEIMTGISQRVKRVYFEE